MSASIYYERNGALILGKGFPLNNQDIGKINFFIHKSKTPGRQIFLIIEDEQGLRDVVELQQIGVSSEGKPYKVYRLSLTQQLRFTTARVTLSLFTLKIGTSDFEVSNNSLNVNLTTDRFNLHREIYLTQDLGEKVENYYTKIVTLLEELLNEKGDNLDESCG